MPDTAPAAPNASDPVWTLCDVRNALLGGIAFGAVVGFIVGIAVMRSLTSSARLLPTVAIENKPPRIIKSAKTPGSFEVQGWRSYPHWETLTTAPTLEQARAQREIFMSFSKEPEVVE